MLNQRLAVMNTNAIKLLAEHSSALAAPLQIVLTYDFTFMAKSARTLLDGFLTKWAADIDVHRDEWNFAELEHPTCHTEALELARQCDIFIIAITGSADLPASFHDWLQDWFESRANLDTALILLVAGDSGFANLPRCSTLPAQARAHGLTFFTTTIPIAQPLIPAAVNPKALLARLGFLSTEALPDFSGINE
jgi:hypothetical protein